MTYAFHYRIAEMFDFEHELSRVDFACKGFRRRFRFRSALISSRDNSQMRRPGDACVKSSA